MNTTASEIMTWNNVYSVGIDKVDDEHKVLIEKINALYTPINRDDAAAVILPYLDDLMEYTLYHFSEEEKLMRDAGYKDYTSHKGIHDTIVGKLKEFHQLYAKSKADQRTGMELILFLKSWLFKHIQTVDKEYSPTVSNYLQKGG